MRMKDIVDKASFDAFCGIHFPGKTTKWGREYCFVKAGNILGNNLHYEFYKGKVHLHIEGREWKDISAFLASVNLPDSITPGTWNHPNCSWTLDSVITDKASLFEAFIQIRDIMEPYLEEFDSGLSHMDAHVVTVSDLLCSTLAIPEYQRPYRWEEKNVRQLLDDIFTSWEEEKSLYRIGSVILHRYRKDSGWVNDIVDGQQRITTILLILKALEHNAKTQLTYNHTDSYKNICLNYAYIKDWLRENVSGSETDFLKYLLDNCQFVQITVSDRSEAFQMFDSQNGRGRELEAYNLLKSYHIRAMDQNTHEEKIACDVRWEQAVQYDATPLVEGDANFDILKQIFAEQLYRSRLWTRGITAGEFTKKHLDEFKGFTIDKNNPIRYPYQNPQLLQYLTSRFYQNTLKGTIATANRMKGGDRDNVNPFASISQTIVNGKEFFDYVETYVEMYKTLFLQMGSYQLAEFKRFYYAFCLDYACDLANADNLRRADYSHFPKGAACRTGDGYLRELYKSLIMVLFDRFGEKGLEKYYKTLYRLVYHIRLTNSQVRYQTVSEMGRSGYFQIICNAKELSDLRELDKMLERVMHETPSAKYEKVSERVRDFILTGK